MERIIKVADFLGEEDWVRLSLDSATDETFQELHKPPRNVDLYNICSHVKEFKAVNKQTLLGFSYIIFWKGCRVDGCELLPNVEEMPLAVKLAIENDFDYISFKPCLVKGDETNNRETLLYIESTKRQKEILGDISRYLKEAQSVGEGKIKVVESVNLRSLFSGRMDEMKQQPRNCHAQVFRWVVSPIGIFHCPAYRGDSKAMISERDGCKDSRELSETIKKNIELQARFNATEECKDIVCFYNGLNRYIEDLIESNQDLDSIKPVVDDNFFI